MASLDWFAAEIAAPAPARPRRARPKAVAKPAPRRRAQPRRLRGGILWISVFALLLTGVVAVNVAVLRAHIDVSKLDKQQLALEQQNSSLAAQVSSAGASQRIEQIAYRFGLRPAASVDTSYIDLGRR
jgi:cell division protein FtsL